MKPTEVEIRDAMNLMDMLFSLGFRKAISYKKKEFENGYKYTELGWYDWVEENKWVYNGDLFCARGATKVCIWREDYDWVIKVAYRRETNPWYIERESTEDFCELEEENYRKACAKGLERFFAAIYKIGSIDGVDIYLQERVTVDEDEISSRFDAYSLNVYGEGAECEDEEDRIEALFGREGDALYEFVSDNDINDLHEGNWGYTDDGRIVCFDYSGYMG